MRIQIVLHQNDLVGALEVGVAEVFQDLRVVDRGTPIGDLDVAPAFERGEQHEQIGRPLALVLVVVARRLARQHRQRRACLRDELFAGFIEADQRSGRIVRPGIDLEHVLHRGDERGVRFGRNHPVFVQMGLQGGFFSARPTVLKCAAGTILRSTTCSANRRIVQLAWPSGGCEHASAISWACRSPSKMG